MKYRRSPSPAADRFPSNTKGNPVRLSSRPWDSAWWRGEVESVPQGGVGEAGEAAVREGAGLGQIGDSENGSARAECSLNPDG